MDTNITNIINYLIEQNNYEKYLEIGVSDGRVFNKILCGFRCGIDKRVKIDYTRSESINLINIETPDFFEQNKEKFDIVVLSKKNDFETSKRDLNYAFDVLKENGTIVVNNCNPVSDDVEKYGEAYKVIAEMRHDSSTGLGNKIKAWTVDVQDGVCVIRTGENKVKDNENIFKKIKCLKGELMNWDIFKYYKQDIMNIIKFATFLNIFNTEFDQPEPVIDSIKEEVKEEEEVVEEVKEIVEEKIENENFSDGIISASGDIRWSSENTSDLDNVVMVSATDGDLIVNGKIIVKNIEIADSSYFTPMTEETITSKDVIEDKPVVIKKENNFNNKKNKKNKK